MSGPERAMTVAGVMSGTSADGIDVALVRIGPPSHLSRKNKDAAKVEHPVNEGIGFPPMRKKRAWMGHRDEGEHPAFEKPKLTLLAHEAFPYPAALRRAVLAAMNAERTSTAELARLNWRLGMEYARAVRATAEKHGARLELIGCHGQTLYHQGKAEAFAGKSFACTWQAGEPALLAAEMGVPVVSNFRPADMAVGGQGAPLVPLLDYVLFADAERGRVLQNIGGIANLTAIAAGAGPEAVVAFDTGPGNMVMDWLAGELLGKRFDRDGRAAGRGKIIEEALKQEVRHPFYKLPPPKSAGREQFGAEYAAEFLRSCRRWSAKAEDALATATALTASTIGQSYLRYVGPRMKSKPVDFIVSGGGARNGSLMSMLRMWLEKRGCAVTTSADFGLPEEAKEAAAFALLAWMTWHRRPGNLPAATGAGRAVVLGSVTHV
ncbi:MAG TPA: anhydro-N-acetylmuramic acid kinase [Terracidiphilus sp.]|jgi:anhydro-N-acetylmuramic acid kinase|nr:anhydro-N-acetylmuramic acid kinase [Terracidiphilus sp.]